MTKIKVILLVLLVFLVYSCASTPDETPEEETVTTEEETTDSIEVEPEPPVEEETLVIEESPITETEEEAVEPFDDELITNAKKAIFKAEEARASTYYPGRLNQLKEKLRTVYEFKDSDPDKAREIITEVQEEAELLTMDSWEALKVACLKILNSKTDKLLELEADKYTTEEFKITQDQKADTENAFDSDDFTQALALYRIAYTSLTNLHDTLAKNIEHVDNLLKLLEKYKAEGESLDSKKWASEEYNLAVESYKKAYKLLYTDYDAVNGEATLRDTLFLARKAIKQTKINIAVSETDDEILGLMDELEKASTLTVVDEEDNIISPTEWKGEAKLKEKPIEAVVEEVDEPGLEEVDLEKDVEVDFPEVSKSIQNGSTEVLGTEETRGSLLEEAKRLWALGIEARNNGDLETAQEYLAKSKVYLDEYKSMAVENVYTVILNPARRDCLWRIAEKKEFYNDPFKWQLIWERNKKLIQDPDLIYPGWKLIIPPLD